MILGAIRAIVCLAFAQITFPSHAEEPVSGSPYSPFPDEVVVTRVMHFDNWCWKVAAGNGTWYFETGETDGKTGFSSAFDHVGNDWIGNDADKGYNLSPRGTGKHEYRGWPNFGNGNFDHPQRSSGSSTRWVDANGEDLAFDVQGVLQGAHLRMRSANETYELEYHFFPSHIAIEVIRADDTYAFLFEGPIGGEMEGPDVDKWYFKDGTENGQLCSLTECFSPFIYFLDTDPRDDQIFYIGAKNLQEGIGGESYVQKENMVVVSYGRVGAWPNDNRSLTGTDSVAVFGFHDKAGHKEISRFIEDRLAAPFSSIRAGEVRGMVRDSATLLPVAGVEVSWSDSDRLTRTDAAGNFVLPISDEVGSIEFSESRYWKKGMRIDTSGTELLDVHLQAKKQRLVVTTDIGGEDPDDEQSMVHLLVAANEFELEGFIIGYAWLDDYFRPKDLSLSIVEAYEECLPNLRTHADGYPSADTLRSILATGQKEALLKGVGEGMDSEGSELIISVVDKDDPRPVWINAWGGTNTIAQAIWKVHHTRSPEEFARFIHKIRIYDILGQCDTGAWMAKTFPELIYIRTKSIYGWAPSDEWVAEHVQSHGPLGPKYRDRRWATEGDSPAFMHLVSRGLNDPNEIDQGGWGGRFSWDKKPGIRTMDIVIRSGVDETIYDPYEMISDTEEGIESIKRWQQSIFNHLEARMDWSVTPDYADANHFPVAVLSGDTTRQILEASVVAGSEIELSAIGSSDPDGDQLSFLWQVYKEPSSFKGDMAFRQSTSSIATLEIPKESAGKSIHVILEVSDDGNPKLTSYRRMVLEVPPSRDSG
ncbi:conserved hypothetical protein, putative [Verrucomicrobiia bacterium DG1235]|nr:conserved hypothetical protein, putative [Verrucomicrobiae bacterium DG1235]